MKRFFIDVYEKKGCLLIALNKPDEAKKKYGRMFTILYEHKEYSKPLDTCNKILTFSSDGVTYHCKGIVLLALEEYEAALAACNKSIELGPEQASTHHSKGLALVTYLSTDKPSMPMIRQLSSTVTLLTLINVKPCITCI